MRKVAKRMKVCVVTGTRAEFGIWRPVLRAILASKKLRLQLVVTGMHLQKSFGETVWDIEGEGFEIAARVRMYEKGDTPAMSLARGTMGMAAAFRELKSDLVMVLGDRLEILAAASAALAEQIPIAHVHGGETAPGQWDEQIRHAVTKMAHAHFCATEKAGERILRMGEDPARVHVVGAPALDAAVHEAKLNARIHRRTQVNPLLLLHPSSSNEQEEYRRTRMLVLAIRKAFPHSSPTGRISAIGPNNDPGHQGILRTYRELSDIVGVEVSVSQDLFWAGLHNSGLLIGNSSSGIIEAASFGIPVVNVGERQAGRERNGNVIDVGWEAGTEGIEKAIKKATWNEKFLRVVDKRRNLYGDGRASERIVKVLEGMGGRVGTVKRWFEGGGKWLNG